MNPSSTKPWLLTLDVFATLKFGPLGKSFNAEPLSVSATVPLGQGIDGVVVPE
jgi:hypothetical protein